MGTSPKELHNEKLGRSVVASLEKRHFESYYCNTASEALEKAISLIPEKSTVAWGGSMTIRDMGLTKALHERDYTVIDRDLAKNPQETYEIHRQGLLSDYYLTSANAVSEDGILVNIDGNGNRVAAYCFGPKNVIVICGINKVTGDLESAVSRARHHAAPVNAMRFDIKTPCVLTGKCGNCSSIESVCAQVLITRLCRPANRIKVILVGEAMGF